MWFLKIILFPFACLYGLIMKIRDKLFDFRILRAKSFDLPVISVGNLCFGGTGKTPHVEYLARLLGEKYHVAILSRGYGRKTRGHLIASVNNSDTDLGDESLQYFRKFNNVTVAVNERRKQGIIELLKDRPGTEIILLDDAFQHRWVKPGLSILLTDYHHLFVEDYPLPTGTLREFRSGAKRADMIVVTKTPKIFSPILRRQISRNINPRPDQKIFYSYITYDTPQHLSYTGITNPFPKKMNYILMVAGIANSYPLQEHLRDLCNDLTVIEFPDHHKYTARDLQKITDAYHSMISKDKAIITTEKDAMRLDKPEFASYLENIPFYYIPITIQFHDCDDVRFDKLILAYVEKNAGIRPMDQDAR